MTGKLVVLRHGYSEWNALNKFTGWVDVSLSELGEHEARRAGDILAQASFRPNVVFTSVLTRAIDTASIAIEQLGIDSIETHRTWRLNERHYGALTGLDKKEIVQEYGEDQVNSWRRSYDVPPPALPDDSPYDFSKDPLYSEVPCSLIPRSECLKDVRERVIVYFEDSIAPLLLEGKDVLIVAHGNSLRALIMYLEGLSPEEIVAFELPTATPRMYVFDKDFTVVEARYLEDPETVALRASAVKAQTAATE